MDRDQIRRVLTRCFHCHHLAYRGVIGGRATFRCSARGGHCHYKDQKPLLKELKLIQL